MADGFSSRPLLDEGVYLDLPLAEYLADPGLSGSKFKLLLGEAPRLTWESDANPLWLKPEPAANRPRLRGSAAHAAVLEGIEAYEARYRVKPEGVLSSSADLKRWLSAKRAEYIAASIGGKLSKDDREAVKQTGEREDLVARILAIDPTVHIWEADDDVDTLLPADDQYVRLVERYVRGDPVFAPLVSDGLPEVTVIWSDGGVRYKCRPDYINARSVVDLKTYGRAPMRGRSLRAHCIAEAGFNFYDLQAVHNMRGALAMRDMVLKGGLICSSAVSKISFVQELCEAWAKQPPTFRWLFLRMGGPPNGISIPFRDHNPQWREAEGQIEQAVELYRAFTARFAPGELWLSSEGEQEIDERDWPLAVIGEAM